ncbi:MAG: sulfatase-like hydrolase/transferase, partial [Opitutales bacterium]
MKNILMIVAEELRADALGCYGNVFCKTPHLDGLAREGVRFGHHYTVHGKCVPSRVAMLTGTYPSALGCRELTTYPEGPSFGGIAAHLKA